MTACRINPILTALRDLAAAHFPRITRLNQVGATMQFDRTGHDDSGLVLIR